ncbi:AAA family ATPase [Streptomyces polyrhachis]|uniref:Nuclease SbcCD subunit C n=1 Tax=Streptomyces polyrhachis TaxID=1282885 RepID=A0ABW2G831_9ACTN
MRLHRLAVTAFGPFAGREEIDFDALAGAGIFLLHGPTGAGKTSVLDAVCYALYNGVPGARQGGPLRSDHAPADTPTEVELEFTVGGRRLRVTRRPAQQRPKKRGTGTTEDKAVSLLAEWGESGEWKALSRSHQEIGEEVGQLLGMTREQFCQVVLLPQGDFARFLRADAEARARLLGRLFDTRRFAEVEERLARLRREAGEAVAAGDERLISLAHRMAQAAGGLADVALPEVAAGEPGLTAAVLAYAALARSTARELREAAALAARTADRAHVHAEAQLAEVRELARLQQEYAAARRRREQARALRPEYERVRADLDRARAADAVVPALELRQAADGEHRAAAYADSRTRAQLPPTAGQESAERLAAREREVREALGSLTAARGAETRRSALDGELAALQRESDAAQGELAEAAQWLEGWEARRAVLQQRADSAQAAAMRAEQLTARLEGAERTLRAARRRDSLTGEEAAAHSALLLAREAAAAARERWLDRKERRLLGVAAELAAALRPGAPCPVCGSAEHPAPAALAGDHVDRDTEDRALADHRAAEARREEAGQRLRSVREALAAAVAEAAQAPAAELEAERATLDEQLTAARGEAAGALAARAALEAAEAQYERRLAQRQDGERRAAARTSRREALQAERATLDAQLAAARGEAPTVAARATQLTYQCRLLEDAAAAAREAELTALRLKEADARLADAAFRAGFDTPAAAVEAVRDRAAQARLQHRLDAWQREEAADEDTLADHATARAAEQPPADLAAGGAALDAATKRLRPRAAAAAQARARTSELDRLSREAAAEVRRIAPLRARYEQIARLAFLAAGTSADNERKMRLESYVLAARLEQVAAVASVRLRRMSAGRFTLVHSDDRAGRGRWGLGLRVVDAWTGSEREASTLSGGESFFASLALALGLADVVTQEAGGVRLDTLFIDEGFGSLDEESLEEVLDVLDSLRESDRAVGIVSHVPDLRRRIPTQLHVAKTPSGSTVRHRTAGE